MIPRDCQAERRDPRCIQRPPSTAHRTLVEHSVRTQKLRSLNFSLPGPPDICVGRRYSHLAERARAELDRVAASIKAAMAS